MNNESNKIREKIRNALNKEGMLNHDYISEENTISEEGLDAIESLLEKERREAIEHFLSDGQLTHICNLTYKHNCLMCKGIRKQVFKVLMPKEGEVID